MTITLKSKISGVTLPLHSHRAVRTQREILDRSEDLQLSATLCRHPQTEANFA